MRRILFRFSRPPPPDARRDAGTGKSVCLREIIRVLRQHGAQDVFVTASTGIAAVNVEGSTIYSYSGIGLGKEERSVLLRKVNLPAQERWRKTRVLVIDESEWYSYPI